MMSSCEEANKTIVRIARMLDDSDCELQTVSVAGKDNVADDPSRDAEIDPVKDAATWALLQEAINGRNQEQTDPQFEWFTSGDKLRHDVPLAPEEL